MEVLPQEISILKEEIEKSFGLAPEMKNDYERLSKRINDRLTELFAEEIEGRNNVSEHTLMRIWGYVESNTATSKATLILLARSIGYSGWDDFKSKINNTYNPSVPSIEEVFESQREEIRKLQKEIPNKNATYILGWYPEKYSKLKYLGGFGFEVIESKNMKKKATETFISPDFSLSPVENSKFPDIMLDDYDDDYFDTQRKEEGEQFDEDYFYL
jgi:Helix-turn-helix domain, rpiR family.